MANFNFGVLLSLAEQVDSGNTFVFYVIFQSVY